jgi:hypothetical protein
MKAYREYLELFEYFGRQGMNRLTPEEFQSLDNEFADLVGRLAILGPGERERLAEIKAQLLRDKP